MADVLYSETEVVNTVITYEDHTVFVTTDVPSALYSESDPQVLYETSPQVVFQLITQSEVVCTLVTKEIGPQGPPGPSNFVDIKRMINLNYKNVKRRFTFNDVTGDIEKITVYNADETVLLFEKILFEGKVEIYDHINKNKVTLLYTVTGIDEINETF